MGLYRTSSGYANASGGLARAAQTAASMKPNTTRTTTTKTDPLTLGMTAVGVGLGGYKMYNDIQLNNRKADLKAQELENQQAALQNQQAGAGQVQGNTWGVGGSLAGQNVQGSQLMNSGTQAAGAFGSDASAQALGQTADYNLFDAGWNSSMDAMSQGMDAAGSAMSNYDYGSMFGSWGGGW